MDQLGGEDCYPEREGEWKSCLIGAMALENVEFYMDFKVESFQFEL